MHENSPAVRESFRIQREGGTWDQSRKQHAAALTKDGLRTLEPEEHVAQMLKNISDGPQRVQQGLLDELALANMGVSVDLLVQRHGYKRRKDLKPGFDKSQWGNAVTSRENDALGYQTSYNAFHKDKNRKRVPNSRYLGSGDLGLRQDPDLLIECDMVRFPNRPVCNMYSTACRFADM